MCQKTKNLLYTSTKIISKKKYKIFIFMKINIFFIKLKLLFNQSPLKKKLFSSEIYPYKIVN